MSAPNNGPRGKTVAVLDADFTVNRLGLPSLLDRPLGGKPILRHTVERLKRARAVDEIVVVAPDEKDGRKAASMLDGLGVTILTRTFADVPQRSLLRRMRKWAINTWRGGIAQTTYYDESGNPAMLLFIQDQTNADVILYSSSAAALIDPDLCDGLCEWHSEYRDKVHYTFSCTPPGLTPEAFEPDILRTLASLSISPGSVMAYRPEKPEMDALFREANYKVDQDIVKTPFRFSADTKRAFEFMDAIVGKLGPEARARDMADFVRGTPALWPGRLPRDVEIEITTQCPLHCVWCPRNVLDRPDCEVSVDQFACLVDSLAVYDDVCLTLSGFGEPTLHPRLTDMIRLARDRGVFGIALETNGLTLDKKLARELVESDVDIVAVSLDAVRPEVYSKLKGSDKLAQAAAGVDTLISVRDSMGAEAPVVVPRMVKAMDNDAEWVPFYDKWFRRADYPLVRTFNDFAGRLDDRTPIHLAPPKRIPCTALFRSMLVLADGTVPVCRQDLDALCSLGNAFEQPLEEIWHSPEIEKLRRAHAESVFDTFALCPRCRNWYY